MARFYTVPPEAARHQERRVGAATIGVLFPFLLAIPLARLLHIDTHSMTLRDWATPVIGLSIACFAVFLNARSLRTYQIALDENQITKTSKYLRTVRFAREEIRYIREVRKSGLIIEGPKDRSIFIPLMVADYDDLKSKLSAWYPVQQTWF